MLQSMFAIIVVTFMFYISKSYGSMLYSSGSGVMSFDGTNNKVIDLSNVFQCVQGNNPRSFSFMIQTTQTNGGAIIETGSYAFKNSFTIAIGWSGWKSTAGTISVIGHGADYFMTSPAINDNQWHSVIVSWDGTALKIFIDNVLVCFTSAYNFFYSDSTKLSDIKYNTVGNRNYLGRIAEENGGYFFIGNLKNVAVFDTAYPFTLAPSVAPTTFGPTISPSTAAPSVAPSALVVIPNLPTLPTCPAGWTLQATCVWTDGDKRVYQEASPILEADISYKFTAAYTIAVLLIGMMIGMMMYAYCILPSKDKVRHAEYMPIYESG